MPEKVTMWGREEVQSWVWDLLDTLKKIDEDFIKEWVRETWEDPGEVYE
jgi:hypothetical protein